MPAPPLILIVDDVAANRETLLELLASGNYQFQIAADGPSALQLAAAVPPDLVLLDVMMPGLDGYEVCRRLRADARLADVPILMVTALDDSASRLAGLEAGADDFIVKPFNRLELRARVRTITRLNRYRRLLETQESLQASEARFRLLAEHSDEVFWFAALNPQHVLYVSPAVERIWGKPAADFRADPHGWEREIHPDDQPRVQAAFAAVLAGRAPRFREEYRVVRPDGTVRWVIDTGTPIRGADGTLTSVGGVARDVTEAKEATDRLLRAQRLENIGMLAAGIAHDFNNSLAPIVMGCPLLRSQLTNAGAHHLLDLMETAAGRSVALVRQLLSFAHGAAGQRQLLQVRHVLRELGDLARATFPKSIHLHAELPGELWPVLGNATQVHQVFLNLCVNARDAMPAGGTLTLTAANHTLDAAAAAGLADGRPGDYLEIAVQDTGTGILPAVLPHIWDPFYTSKSADKGTGLGLATVRGIVHQHGGFVTVQTKVDHGTTFTVYLPAALGTAGAQDGPPLASADRGRDELILIVDDEEPVRALTAQILEAYGYRTLTACDGAEAIAIFVPRREEVRLLLTDLQMPLLSGAALATALHRLNPALPIIAMSGVEEGSSSPFLEFTTEFLAKPFQAETLLTMVRATLDAHPAETRPLRPANR
jgi:two-component system cell cycle sensor histidine kinase/response regulator CckA